MYMCSYWWEERREGEEDETKIQKTKRRVEIKTEPT